MAELVQINFTDWQLQQQSAEYELLASNDVRQTDIYGVFRYILLDNPIPDELMYHLVSAAHSICPVCKRVRYGCQCWNDD